MTSRAPPIPTRNIKSEAIKVNGGFVTPSSSIGTLTLKQEDVEVSFSDIIEGNVNSFRSHDGLPHELDDEGYATQSTRKIRSDAPSFRTSRQSSFTHGHGHIDLTMDPQTPGSSLQVVGKKVNLLIDAIEKLRHLGLSEIATELPELVLVGDQSAGKSSLMGALAEINLPKDLGMCTRCPANIKTSPADTWTCSVSLHESYIFSPDSHQKKSTKTNPFPPWKEKDKSSGLTITPFATIREKSELEDVLRWAQIALLNPSHDPKVYVPGTGAIARKGLEPGKKHEADFSPNLVAIEISGPGLPALSFYDLPGIFVNAAAKEEAYLISVFERLATKYILHPNALIICAMTMQSDPGLSRTNAIIADLKADKRCVGVLTMPDRLQEGSTHTDFDKILRGETHRFPEGYFVTKQPGPDFRLRSADYHAQAREEEEAFFNSDSRWTGEWAKYRARCGTAAIQNYLSLEFANQINKNMPSIHAKIKAETEDVDRLLDALPPLPNHNVQHKVRDRLQIFSNHVQRMLEGGRDNSFLSHWSQLSIDFRDVIQAMRPLFTYSHPSDSVTPEIINVDDSDTESPTTPRIKRPAPSDFATPQAQRQQTADGSGNRPTNSMKQEGSRAGSPVLQRRRFSQQNPQQPRSTAFDQFLNAGRGFMNLDDIHSIIMQYTRPGLPDHIDDAAKEDMCLLAVNPWSGPLDKIAKLTFRMLEQAVLARLDSESCLGPYKQTELYRVSRRHIQEFIRLHAAEQRTTLDALYRLEAYKLFTINNSVFEIYKAEELKTLQDARRKRRVTCYLATQARLNNKSLPADTSRLVAGVTDAQLGPDPFENEIQLAAYVRGYYKTAGFRFADNVCQTIQGNLFRKVHAEILGLLEGCLNLNEGDGEEKCKRLMIEDENEAVQRLRLQDRKAKLTRAADSLAELVLKLELEDTSQSNESGYGGSGGSGGDGYDGYDGDGDEDNLPFQRGNGYHSNSPETLIGGPMDASMSGV